MKKAVCLHLFDFTISRNIVLKTIYSVKLIFTEYDDWEQIICGITAFKAKVISIKQRLIFVSESEWKYDAGFWGFTYFVKRSADRTLGIEDA